MSTHNPGDERPGNQPDESAAQPSGAHEATPAGPSESDPNLAGLAAAPGQPAATPGQPTDLPESPAPPRPGSVQRQEPGVTQPRPPTVAEARARDKARKRAAEAQRAAAAADDAKKRTRKRVMIGGVAIVGVAALVGGGYLAYRAISAPDKVTASCVKVENGQEIVVEDRYCGDGRPGFVGDGGINPGLIILGAGPQYRYYYGGTPTIGKPPTGGTTVKPKSAEIKTKSGTTIQRGGLGSKSTGGGS
ncbi:hypothetical protein [Nocardia suismassiliense]|uniref:hypothetical protein n=1 Tax=Nocardia suismassiliense TaxID=2077092 RepID=UPI000D1DB8D1|nr:hypothetical protein [Nocardia suismassiliense]